MDCDRPAAETQPVNARRDLLRPWIPFAALLCATLLTLVLAFMALNWLPVPSFLAGAIDGLRGALSACERFFLDRFS